MTLAVTMIDVWTAAIASLSALACALVGVFLVLRRMSLLGDAITHAILPGLVIAFLITGARSPGAMLAGAAAAGLLTAVLSAALQRGGRVNADAAMGVTFSTFFAVGVVLISFVAPGVDLDANCVLMGSLDTAGIVGPSRRVPESFPLLAGVAALNTVLVCVFFKELKIVAFDPALATAMGINAAAVHYSMMGLVAATSVASFDAVGSVMVVTMLVAPAATAHLLTDRLSRLLLLACVIGVACAVGGYALAVVINATAAGTISSLLLAVFCVTVVAAPRHGVASRAWARLTLAARVSREDMLGLIYRWHENAQPPEALPPTHSPTPSSTPPFSHSHSTDFRPQRTDLPGLTRGHVLEAVGAGTLAWWGLRALTRTGHVRAHADGTLRLTDSGLAEARTLVRSHRLWEGYLARHLGLPLDHLHAPSHRVEHFIGDQLRTDLEREHPAPVDPHGRAIPSP